MGTDPAGVADHNRRPAEVAERVMTHDHVLGSLDGNGVETADDLVVLKQQSLVQAGDAAVGGVDVNGDSRGVVDGAVVRPAQATVDGPVVPDCRRVRQLPGRRSRQVRLR